MIIISFFRDFLSGWKYVLYVLVCIFLQFSLYGIIADRKRRVIEEGLQAKKKRDIESGKEAEKAALADKQILDVYDENGKEETSSEEVKTEEEEAPQVLIIGDDEN